MNLIKTATQNAQQQILGLAKPFREIFFNPYFSDCTYYIITGGNSSGKSHSTALYWLYRLMNNKGLNDVMMREHLTHVYGSQYKFLRNHIEALGIEKDFEISDASSSNSRNFQITYKPTKSTIIGKGLCTEHDIMSLTGLTGAWLEEASQFKREYAHKFFTQGRKKGFPIKFFLTLNPVSRTNYTYTDFIGRVYKQLPESRPVKWYNEIKDRDGNVRRIGTAAVRTTYLDNLPNLDDAAIYNIEKYKYIMPEYYEVYGLGKFGSLAEGLIFKREHYKTYREGELPSDCVGFIYCDPNHAPKCKGDTTAIVNLWVSLSKKKFYIKSARCFNCTDPPILIEAILQMRDSKTIKIGFDGSFGQEAQWTHNFNTYARSKGIHIAQPEYIKPQVDAWSKNAQFHYGSENILFPANFGKDDETALFLDQFHAFSGKANTPRGRKDDAPDALICAIQLAFEHNYKFY
jgi:PBSX family phage terminase large subunit